MNTTPARPTAAADLSAATCGQPRRPRAAALLNTAALLATAAPLAATVFALAPAPLAAAVPVAAASAQHAVVTVNGDDPCVAGAATRALGPMKVPNCAGD